MKGFMNFVREQGVVGFAVGFILGGAIAKVVTAALTDLVNPLLGLILGSTKGLEKVYFSIAGAKIMYGDFLSVLINFIVVAAVVYISVKILRLEKIDRKKDK